MRYFRNRLSDLWVCLGDGEVLEWTDKNPDFQGELQSFLRIWIRKMEDLLWLHCGDGGCVAAGQQVGSSGMAAKL